MTRTASAYEMTEVTAPLAAGLAFLASGSWKAGCEFPAAS